MMARTGKYRPANGTEGLIFMGGFCDRCEKDEAYRNDTGDSCPIVAATVSYEVDDDEYPSEWTFDDKGNPVCTAFEAAEEGE